MARMPIRAVPSGATSHESNVMWYLAKIYGLNRLTMPRFTLSCPLCLPTICIIFAAVPVAVFTFNSEADLFCFQGHTQLYSHRPY